jgi:4-amino-4-deoxy-L-arabinose transferase-like glycosyltransferase
VGLSARLFGVNAWSLLVPQALMGVATVGLLHGCVRRWFGPAAGLLAGAVMALTPVAVLMFRFNNPDALLVLLLVAGLVGGLPWEERLRAGWAGPGGRRMAMALAIAGLLVALAGPAAYALDTAATPHSGAIPSAGPDVPGARGGPGGGLGGLLDGANPDAELVALLQQDADRYTWVAAAVGSNSAAGVQLAAGDPVMAIGGFNGSDPSPTLAQFRQYVAEGRIHYFLGGGRLGGSMGGSDAAREISAWVQQNFTATSVGGATVYDLTG